MTTNEPRICPALTLLDFDDGTFGVTLHDYFADCGEVATITRFDTKEEAEAFIAECRADDA